MLGAASSPPPPPPPPPIFLGGLVWFGGGSRLRVVSTSLDVALFEFCGAVLFDCGERGDEAQARTQSAGGRARADGRMARGERMPQPYRCWCACWQWARPRQVLSTGGGGRTRPSDVAWSPWDGRDGGAGEKCAAREVRRDNCGSVRSEHGGSWRVYFWLLFFVEQGRRFTEDGTWILHMGKEPGLSGYRGGQPP